MVENEFITVGLTFKEEPKTKEEPKKEEPTKKEKKPSK